MMNVFGNSYAKVYDLLYKDKDYPTEAAYIDRFIQERSPSAQSVLDLGCGTGRHACCLADLGYEVHGVDISEDLLSIAKQAGEGKSIQFTPGDIQSVRLPDTFDAVVSLFHVMCYQNSNDQLLQAFDTACHHLKPGGIFLFDCWYGPAVLTNPPAVRVKQVEDERIELIRIAEPVMHANENKIDVHYRLFGKEKASGTVEEWKETHSMRYLFKPEVELMLELAGFALEGSFEYMTGREPDMYTWNVCFVGRKR